MQNDSNLETPQAEIPAYLQCEPRSYRIRLNEDDICDLDFTLVIKCTDDMLHEHNNFWSGYADRLAENDDDIVAVVAKIIARDVFYACHQGKDFVSIPPYTWGINSIFHEEGWMSNCFEITTLSFENYLTDSCFDIKPLTSKKEG